MQFFTSKKRKALSPGLKPGRNEKDVKTRVEGSPSGKGTLDNFLVTSQDVNITNMCAGRDSLARQDPVKRNLSLEIDGCMNDECKWPSQSQAAETLETQKGTVEGLPEVSGVAVGVQGAENSEIKKFATYFLPLYCRYCSPNSGTIRSTCLLSRFLTLSVHFLYLFIIIFLMILSLG